jgi:hypothetical protein
VREDPAIQVLIKRWKNHAPTISPISQREGHAAYTRNKGASVSLCIPDNPEEHNIQIATYILTHELAHIASKSWHHTPEFKRNFRKLLTLATVSNVYKDQRFSATNPGNFCGETIRHSPI